MKSSLEMRHVSTLKQKSYSKKDSKVCITEDGERPQVARGIMYALFFYAKGHIAQIPAPERANVTRQFKATKGLPEFVKYDNARPCTGTRISICCMLISLLTSMS